MFFMSLIRTLIGIVPAALLAIPLFGISAFELGLPLLVFFANLLLAGWWIALIVIALILRFGMGAEGMAWLIVFLLAPVSCIYYPLDVLPEAVAWIALALPPAHVFEGMRRILFDDMIAWGHLAAAVALNAAYMAIGGAAFMLSFRDARRRGALLQQGE
jgi:ABC-2 type transport system permease protein